jgi:hypothetical protein
LDRVNQCRPITLTAEIFSHFNGAVGTQANEVPVESCMVQGAERQSVAYVWDATRLGIRDDMCRVQQLLMAKVAECTLPSVRLEDSFPKRSLVEAYAYRRRYVRSPSHIGVLGEQGLRSRPWQPEMLRIINGDDEGEIRRTVFHHEYWPGYEVLSRDDTVYVNEWKPTLHGEPQATVVEVVGIGPSIPIA